MIFQGGSHIASVLSERWNNKSAENIIWNLLAGIVCQMWKSYLILLLWDMKEKRDDIRYEDSLYLVIATMIDKTQLADSIWSTGRKSFWTKLKKLYWWWSGVCNSNSIFNIEDNLITFKRCCVMIANEVRRRNNRVCFRRLSQKNFTEMGNTFRCRTDRINCLQKTEFTVALAKRAFMWWIVYSRGAK